ncbi:MAG TPA: phosphonate ABC transporter, permease protein PhnE [Acidimicrobiales bacterium]|nr:phosphonate ABC transporter, permease protein PhnE [Acidimicrobiales bacterium]
MGVLPGILALGCDSVGMLGKLYAETIEQVAPGPPEAVRSSGQQESQSSGNAASRRRQLGRPRQVMVGRLVDRLFPVRRPGQVGSYGGEKLRPPWTRQRLQRSSFVAGALAVVGASFVITKTTPWEPFLSLRQIWATVSLYFPPNLQTERGALLTGVLQSLAVAVIATTAGYFFAVPIGLLAARNVSQRWVARAARLFLVIVRAVPELVIAIVFIVAVGLGLVAGALALTVGSIGFLGKLVADGLEEVPPTPREAVLSTGATKPQEIATSVIAPTAPMLMGNALYTLDINFRSVAILGIVGGGGIGYLLWQSVNILAYRTTGAIILVTFVVVLLIEVLANWVRKHLI